MDGLYIGMGIIEKKLTSRNGSQGSLLECNENKGQGGKKFGGKVK